MSIEHIWSFIHGYSSFPFLRFLAKYALFFLKALFGFPNFTIEPIKSQKIITTGLFPHGYDFCTIIFTFMRFLQSFLTTYILYKYGLRLFFLCCVTFLTDFCWKEAKFRLLCKSISSLFAFRKYWFSNQSLQGLCRLP